MITREITWEIITPLFGGGADASGKASIRIPAFKGVLRWWWRATGLIDDSSKLHRREGQLFGQVHGDHSRKSALRLWLVDGHNLDTTESWVKKIKGQKGKNAGTLRGGKLKLLHGTKFLTYGAWALGNSGVNRESIVPGQRFTIGLRYPEAYAADYNRALRAIHLFGGIGMKSRNGLGQIQIVKDSHPITDLSVQSTGKVRSERLFPQLGQAYQVGLSSGYSTFDEALESLGEAYNNVKSSLTEHEKNVFAGHQPKALGLHRKAAAVQLYVRKETAKAHTTGMVMLPHNLFAGRLSGSEHLRVVDKFEAALAKISI